VVTHGLNLEMASADEIVNIACDLKPDQATLVPERRQELTTEGGLDIVLHQDAVGKALQRLRACAVQVSLFIDPDPRQIEMAKVLGAKAIEIQTARYAEARGPAQRQRELDLLQEAAETARQLGLHVHLGHGLNYENVRPVVQIPGVEELNIGHSIVSRAVLVGMERAVREMKEAIRDARTL
jgi:pyridoxine 5-phosphate synthase